MRVEKSVKTSVKVTMNGHITNSAIVSEQVTHSFLSLAGGTHKVLAEHDFEVPIECGFGSSGAGALSLALALNEAFNVNLSRLKAAQIAHVAEIENKTGLGTVIAETFGGLEIRVKSGAPSVGKIKSIPISNGYVVACLNFGPTSTREILTDEAFRQRINRFGGTLVDELAKHPTLDSFMGFSRKFAEHLGVISKKLRAVLQEADRAGLTCSVAMLGETVFSIVKRDQVKEVHEIFSKHAPSERSVIMAEVDFKGARLL